MTWRGVVAHEARAPGSKSERVAVVLVTEERHYVLRRRGGHAFEDPELDALVGKRIELEGELHGYTLLMDSWREVS